MKNAWLIDKKTIRYGSKKKIALKASLEYIINSNNKVCTLEGSSSSL